ncbi:MAG: hypothetical protein ASUL_00965 [Candidatus Aramenus sulfurataquae]|uniref:Uncharacterized protein n=1 Tax=Candidatus Aramenus sulfurataquae TaxID=1326980 RepID=W7KY10_9CREN|nr:MAG: hypothetical protein ASUL_00965 [Candidatus Aramenus sulfurataquae]
MKHPVFTYLTKLELPPINFWLDFEDSKVKLNSEALEEPRASLYPELQLGEGKWIYQKGNSIISFSKGKSEVMRTSNHADVVFVRVEDSFYEIVRVGDWYSFEGEQFFKLIRYMGRTLLAGKRRALLFAQGKMLELEAPLDFYVTRRFTSLVFEGETKVIDEKLNVTSFKREGYFLGLTSRGKVFKRGNRIYLEDRLIGFCNGSSYFLGEMLDKIVFLCDSSAKIFSNWSWTQIEAEATEDRSYVNSNFLILGSMENTSVYDSELNPIFSLKPSSVVADNRRLFALSETNYFGVVDSGISRGILRVINDKNSATSKIRIAYDKYFNVSFSKPLVVVSEEEMDDYRIVELEPEHFENAEVEIALWNPFYSESRILKFSSEKPRVSFDGEVMYSPEGKVKGTEHNALLKGVLAYEIPTRLPTGISLKVGNQEARLEVKNTKGVINVVQPLSLSHPEDNVVVSAYLIRGKGVSFLKDFVVPVKLVNPPIKVVKLARNRGHVRELSFLRDDGVFTWERVRHYPNYFRGLIIGVSGENVTLEGREIEVKNGFQSVCFSRGFDEVCYDVLGVKRPVIRLEVTLEENYLIVKPVTFFTFPMEVFYGLNVYRGFPAKILFPFDPSWNTIRIRSYIGVRTVTQDFKLGTMDTALKKALLDSVKLREILSSFGLA